jgi:hypothetical protein
MPIPFPSIHQTTYKHGLPQILLRLAVMLFGSFQLKSDLSLLGNRSMEKNRS